MKKTTKKNSAMKKMIPALGMLMISASMLATSTYAWFTMSDTVTVTGMKLQATAQDGLIISDYNQSNWGSSQNVNMDSGAVLVPTSAAAVASPTFVKNTSDLFDNAKADQSSGFETLSLNWSAEAATTGSVGSTGTAPNLVNYVLKRTFYIKGTGNEAWNTNLVIDEVSATGVTNSAELDKSLRVLIVATDQGAQSNNTNAFVYAPLAGATTSYNWMGTASGAVAVSAVGSTTDSTCTNVASIPVSSTATPIKIEMYMYFEGEDAACKSSNISGISPDTLTVTAKFKTSAGPADVVTP